MKNNAKAEKKSVSKWKIFFIVAGSLLLLLAVAVITFIMLLFSSPEEVPARELQANDFYTQSKIAEKVYNQICYRADAGKCIYIFMDVYL